MEIKDIEVSKVEVVPGWNPRSIFNDDYISTLGLSLVQDGQRTPISVMQRGDSFQLIDGECRLRAAIKERILILKARIYTSLSESDVLCMSLKQNLTQSTLGDLDIGIALKKILDERNWSHQRLANVILKKQRWVSSKIALATRISPNIRSMFSSQRLKFSHVLILSRLPHEEQDTAVLEVLRRRMTSRQAREYIQQLLGGNYDRNYDTSKLILELRHIVAMVNTITERHITNNIPLPKAIEDDLIALNHELLNACSMVGVLVRRNDKT